MGRFVFPTWTNSLRTVAGVGAAAGTGYVVLLVAYGASPSTTDVGYGPWQPVAYSHAMHVGELGIDCRYCHNTVETAARAAIPPTQTCLNCHATILADSAKMLPVAQSYANGSPIAWVRVHDLPDYTYFDHGAHVQRGIGCASCHGRVDRMDVVAQVETLSMGWCLDCHRNPEPNLRPLSEVTNMAWVPNEDPTVLGKRLRSQYDIRPPAHLTDCSLCHR